MLIWKRHGIVRTYAVWPLIIGYLVSGLSSACRLETCLNEYSAALEQGGFKGPESTAAYCQQLKAYGACVKSAARSCRGDLQFHTTWSIISTLTKRFNCSRFRTKPQPQQCFYYGKQDYSFCSLYGRPHLLTFSSIYRNCKFQQSSTLINNQFFSLSVTTDKSDNVETLISLVNVTIKSGGTACGSEKQYLAYAHQQLPPFFVDESQTGGLHNTIVINSSWQELTETVHIYMGYIDTSIIIKKFGSYFGISCRMPSEILNFDPGGPELCRSGCSELDVLDDESAVDEQKIWRRATESCSEFSNFSAVSDNNTWTQRDWCLFNALSSYSLKEKTTSNSFPEHVSVPTYPSNTTFSYNNDNNEINVMSQGFLVRHSCITIVISLTISVRFLLLYPTI